MPRCAAVSSPSRSPLRVRARSRIRTLETTHDREGPDQVLPGGVREAAQQVAEDLAQAGARQVHRHRQTGRQQRADRVAGQQQAGQRGEAAQAGEPVDDDDGQQRPDEREAVEQPEPEDHGADRDEDGDGRAEGGAGRRAEHVRVGERVAQQALEGHARRRRGAAPTSIVVRTRGRRSSMTIVSDASVQVRGRSSPSSRWPRIASVSPGSTATVPIPTPRISATEEQRDDDAADDDRPPAPDRGPHDVGVGPAPAARTGRPWRYGVDRRERRQDGVRVDAPWPARAGHRRAAGRVA